MELSSNFRRSVENSHYNSLLGIEKFQAEDERKKVAHEYNLMKNRLVKLRKEEENAKKQFELTQKRAEELMRQKEIRLSFLHEQFNRRQMKLRKEEETRFKMNEEKMKRKEKIRQVSGEVFSNKWNAASEIRTQSEVNEELYRKYKDLVHTQKHQNASFFKQVKKKMVSQRSKSNLEIRNNLREEYLRCIQEHKNEYLRMMNEKSEMIKLEAEMLQRISDTRNLQNKTLEDIKNLQNARSFSQTDNY